MSVWMEERRGRERGGKQGRGQETDEQMLRRAHTFTLVSLASPSSQWESPEWSPGASPVIQRMSVLALAVRQLTGEECLWESSIGARSIAERFRRGTTCQRLHKSLLKGKSN